MAKNTNALNRGEVAVELDGQQKVLTPTLACYQTLASMMSYQEMSSKVASRHVPTIAAVLTAGGAVPGPKVDEAMFRSDLTDVQGAVSDFLFRLFHRGLSPQEWLAERRTKDAEAAGGNGDGLGG